ncbi:MAG: hypothetical protein FJX46_15005 [Alphaproteobacteria bacterium]|nr:hypothetical protein [Alphaproteobacteria bacterium]
MDPGGETVTRLRHDIGEDFASHSAPDHRTVIDHHERLARGEEGPLFTRPKSLGEIVAKNATETVDHDTERSNRQAARYLHDREDLGDHPRFAAEAIKQAGAKGIGEVRDLVAKLFQNNPERGDRYAYDVAKQLDPEQRNAFLGSAEAWDNRPFGVPKDNAPPPKKEETESKEQPQELQAGKGTADPVPLDPAQPTDPTPFQAANAEPQADLADSDGGSGGDDTSQEDKEAAKTDGKKAAEDNAQNTPNAPANAKSETEEKPVTKKTPQGTVTVYPIKAEALAARTEPKSGEVGTTFQDKVGGIEVKGEPNHGYGVKLEDNQGGVALGRYQLKRGALIDAGFKDKDGNWTDKARALGVDSEESFLKSPKAQDAAMDAYMTKVDGYIRHLGLDKQHGREFIGVMGTNIEVTQSGLAAAIHRAGQGEVNAYFKHQAEQSWKIDRDPFPANKKELFLAIETRLREFQNVEYRKR